MTMIATADPLAGLFIERTAEGAARQLACVLAWAVECELATLENLQMVKRTPKSELERHKLIVDTMIEQCLDLGIKPGVLGLQGKVCGRLSERLSAAISAAATSKGTNP